MQNYNDQLIYMILSPTGLQNIRRNVRLQGRIDKIHPLRGLSHCFLDNMSYIVQEVGHPALHVSCSSLHSKQKLISSPHMDIQAVYSERQQLRHSLNNFS